MRAKVIHAFKGQRSTDTEPVDLKAGTELTDGGLAYHAVQMGYAEWIEKPTDAEVSILSKQPHPKPPLEPRKAETEGASTGRGAAVGISQ